MLKRKRPGYFSGCCSETKWLGARKKYKWDLFNEMLPAQAAKFDEVPSWLKTRLFENAKMKGPKQEIIPKELLDIADSVLMEQCAIGLEMDTKSVKALLTSLVDMYNEEASLFNQDLMKKHDDHISQLKKDGALSEAEIDALSARSPEEIPLVSKDWTDKKLDHIVQKFCKQWGYGSYRQDRPSKHLSRERPSIKQLGSYIESLKSEGRIDTRLMFNWDQVWTCFLVESLDYVAFGRFTYHTYTYLLLVYTTNIVYLQPIHY